MKTLILIPSPLEFSQLTGGMELSEDGGPFPSCRYLGAIWAQCGIGPAAATLGAMHLVQSLTPHRVILAGIAGAFTESSLQPGQIMQAATDCYADLGYQVEGRWYNLDRMNLGMLPMRDRTLGCIYTMEILDENSRPGSFVTVSTITASKQRATELRHEFGADMENMEGAAVAMVCAFHGVPCYQVRAASNMVGPRDRDNWHVKEPLSALHDWLGERL